MGRLEVDALRISWHDVEGMLRFESIGMAYVCIPCRVMNAVQYEKFILPPLYRINLSR